jgi:hypothetical protein
MMVGRLGIEREASDEDDCVRKGRERELPADRVSLPLPLSSSRQLSLDLRVGLFGQPVRILRRP